MPGEMSLKEYKAFAGELTYLPPQQRCCSESGTEVIYVEPADDESKNGRYRTCVVECSSCGTFYVSDFD
jgi:hypothetical protein